MTLEHEINDFLEQALDKSAATELSKLIEGYKLCARSEGISENTIMLTERAVSYFNNFLTGSGLPTNVESIGTSEIRSFILHLKEVQRFQSHPFIKSHDRKLTGHTINCYLRSISAFWSWLFREGFLEVNPFARIKIPKAPTKVITPFTEDQIQSLLQALDTSDISGLRAYAIILTFLDTGMRLSELIGLKKDNVDLRNKMLKVFGKGAKERRIPMGKRLLAALWKYQLHRPQPATGSIDNFFLTQDGWPLTKNRVETIIKDLGTKAGLQGVRCSPHTFRHTFCIEFLRNGANLFSLQQMTGHSSLEVLRGYVALAESDVKIAHQKFSPADNLNLKMPCLRKNKHGRKAMERDT
ncbi:MAG: tyrosine-type recombinase/integrase [Dehalococcoidales bacterium]|nr:tyrosine-type recombinase/integrase [Dehalococcoidales bacterium]